MNNNEIHVSRAKGDSSPTHLPSPSPSPTDPSPFTEIEKIGIVRDRVSQDKDLVIVENAETAEEPAGHEQSPPYVDRKRGSIAKNASSLAKVTEEAEQEQDKSKPTTPRESKVAGDGYQSHQRHSSKSTKEKILKLSPAQIQELTSSPESLSLKVRSTTLNFPIEPPVDSFAKFDGFLQSHNLTGSDNKSKKRNNKLRHERSSELRSNRDAVVEDGDAVPHVLTDHDRMENRDSGGRSHNMARTVSTPVAMMRRKTMSSKPNGPVLAPAPVLASSKTGRPIPTPLDFNASKLSKATEHVDQPPSPMPSSIPLPPASFPTYLQLELSSEKPSPLYIHRSATADIPYESSQVKMDRLKSFLVLPTILEQVLCFGAIACLDAWLYTFTILPLRFVKAIVILMKSWSKNLSIELKFLFSFMYAGVFRFWARIKHQRNDARSKSTLGSSESAGAAVSASYSTPKATSAEVGPPKSDGTKVHNYIHANMHARAEPEFKTRRISVTRHRRSRSVPSALLPDHKADILQGLLILTSCSILLHFDASRMYHNIRGQATIKLYVIYNTLEVFDRLFAAIGQDVLECLFSKETLERKPNGRSKVLRPFYLFFFALLYTVIHSTALLYQVITLNVAVNSYSNALLTLLMSNQFVEVKSTVFKKFEKENLFQLTCADVVERFQLWLMLTIIAARNVVETSSLSLSSSPSQSPTMSSPVHATSSILPKSFTLLPPFLGSVTSPFLLVLGSEMLVDWLKHAYVTKFNNTKPAIYSRFLDVLAKDYYSHAFTSPSLTRRLGLPVIPLAVLFIRTAFQTYHMFLSTHVSIPISSSTTSLSIPSEPSASISSPATTAALQHIDAIFRRALGHSSFGAGPNPSIQPVEFMRSFLRWSTDDLIAFFTMIVFFMLLYIIMLAFKLFVGMVLLAYARNRYRRMKEHETEKKTTAPSAATTTTVQGQTSTPAPVQASSSLPPIHADGRRLGGWGVIEVDDDKRRWIYDGDEEALRRLKDKEQKGREKEVKNTSSSRFDGVMRYDMVAKRIW